jgi:hypothetical protein
MQASAAAVTMLRGFVESLFSVSNDLEGVEFFRAGSNAAAAAAAAFSFRNYRRRGFVV